MSINSVRTNCPTLCPIVWLSYAPEYITKPHASLIGFSTYSGAYGSHTIGHSDGPLVHCHIGFGFNNPANLGLLLRKHDSQLGIVVN